MPPISDDKIFKCGVGSLRRSRDAPNEVMAFDERRSQLLLWLLTVTAPGLRNVARPEILSKVAFWAEKP